MSPENSPVLFRVLGLFDNVKRSGSGYAASCPVPVHTHHDKDQSLNVGLGNDGRVLVHCKRGCATDDILSAVGLEWCDLYERNGNGNTVRRFRLTNAAGQVEAVHVREDRQQQGDKVIYWERNGAKGLGGVKTEDLPLYGLGELLAADKATPVIVTEGEKPVASLADKGILAVGTVTGAAGTPSPKALEPLQGREVWLWPDNDDVGREHMARIAQVLLPGQPRWIDWKDAPPKGDAADYIEQGGSFEGIRAMLRQTPVTASGVIPARMWRASELVGMKFDPVRWAIPGLLPAGLAILAGRPKLGKSWLALGWTIDVSSGAPVLKKMDVNQGEALYLALEDGPQRMQERLSLMLGDRPAPHDLFIQTEWPRMNEGGLDQLRDWLVAHPKSRLIVIDTFKRVRPKEKGNQRLYDMDYDAIAPLAELARQQNVAIVVVFHTRKGDSSDPLELVSGTLGLSGAADCVLVLRRERGEADGSLFVTGRDVEEQDLALRWEKDDVLGWSLLGNAEQFRRSKERQEILAAIQAVPGMSPREIADAIGKAAGPVRYLLFAMTRDSEIRNRDGKYFAPNSANGALGGMPRLLSSTTPNTANTPQNEIKPLLVAPSPSPNSSPTALTAQPISVPPVANSSPTRAVRGVSAQVQRNQCGVCGERYADHTAEELAAGCKRKAKT